jgi:hypothetical protein
MTSQAQTGQSLCKDTKKKGNNEERMKKVWKSERNKYRN